MKNLKIALGVFLLFAAIPFGFSQNTKSYKTERVIILIVDGPRYSETWGDSTRQYIPHMTKDLAPKGIVSTAFYNDGFTYTTSGHTAICTGKREELENKKGTDLPSSPSILQYYLKESKQPATKAWVITSKDKLFILGNCDDPLWHNQYLPSTNCGVNGPLSGYREDYVTGNKVIKTLKKHQPNLLLVNFKEPDGAGHANKWDEYLKGIKTSDSLVWEVWKFIQKDEYYKGKTTLIVTNDHGRHLDGVQDGFVNHGDDCDGCRHINFFAFGPDFKEDLIIDEKYAQVDIANTVAELLGFPMPTSDGKVMEVLFK